MKGIIIAIVATAFCTAGVCFVALKSSRARSATIDGSAEDTFKASIDANEQVAIATLKNILVAQAQCHASTSIDANGNGQGEYGSSRSSRARSRSAVGS
ncbi:MAG TPA: hypothetical protein VFT55_04880 [Planctomycetota bacterium]|nr:hypothetical protein [Planctomycetota bacterium]